MKRNYHLMLQRSVLSSITNQDTDYRRPNIKLSNKNKPILQSYENQNIDPQHSPQNPVISLVQSQNIQDPISHSTKDIHLFKQLQKSKQNQDIFKATIKTKFLRANKRPSQSSSDNRRMILPEFRVSTINSSCTKTSNSFANQKQQMAIWLKNAKLKQTKSVSLSKQIKLKNIQKYNVDFVDYLKKKSCRRIQKQKINKIISRKQNIVQMYQQHLLKNSGLGLKTKQKMRKCFDQLNNEKMKA